MNEKYNVYLISDSTGETLDRIFLSLQSQFKNFKYEKKEFFFVRTEQQVDKIISAENNLISAVAAQDALVAQGVKKEDQRFKNAEILAKKSISLPIDPNLSKKELNYIIKTLNEF